MKEQFFQDQQPDSAYGDENRRQQEDRLAADILDHARQTLTLDLRFMDAALNRLNWAAMPCRGMMNDGNVLGYDPRYILDLFMKDPQRVARNYLHTVLHCVFQHVFRASAMDRKLWDLACDIAVEYVVRSQKTSAVQCKTTEDQTQVLDSLRHTLGQVTAERIYCYYRDLPLSPGEAVRLGSLFCADLHDVWYSPEPLQADEERAGGNRGSHFQISSETGKKTEGGSGHPDRLSQEENERDPGSPQENDPQEDWKKIAHRMQIDMKTLAAKSIRQSGSMLQALQQLHRERYDYTSFLQKFSVMGEHLKLDPDEFDYIYYTYGLGHYGNMPLIEPLEYREDRHVREFVIAIDTSGSVRGHLVQLFVQKTYNILKSTESFASRVNIHILQCDNAIREHVRITTLSEFDNYIRAMELKGFGGTDFRPVFQYVDKQIREKEFRDLRGMIYLTDGHGEFPVRQPAYKTAFVFLDTADNNLKIPSWGIPCVLQEEEILLT